MKRKLPAMKRKQNWSCSHDPVCPTNSACTSKRTWEKKKRMEAAATSAAALCVSAIAVKCSESLAASDPAPVPAKMWKT